MTDNWPPGPASFSASAGKRAWPGSSFSFRLALVKLGCGLPPSCPVPRLNLQKIGIEQS